MALILFEHFNKLANKSKSLNLFQTTKFVPYFAVCMICIPGSNEAPFQSEMCQSSNKSSKHAIFSF